MTQCTCKVGLYWAWYVTCLQPTSSCIMMITCSTVASAFWTHHPQLNSVSGSFVKSGSSAQYQCPKRWQSFMICTVLCVSKAIALNFLSFFMCSCRQKCQVLSFSCYIAKHLSTGSCIFVLHARARYESCLNWLHGWRVQLQCVSFTLHLKHMSIICHLCRKYLQQSSRSYTFAFEAQLQSYQG